MEAVPTVRTTESFSWKAESGNHDCVNLMLYHVKFLCDSVESCFQSVQNFKGTSLSLKS